ncbi:calcium-binding protein [Roseovarius sp.]|uniref:calcium-binding protein n=1 Tax=Roseovarius sp. TaxID=1486281 RepID=UPI003B5AFED1
MGFLLLALIGGAAASFLIYDEFIDDDDDNPRDQDVGTPGDGDGPLPENPDDPDDPDTPDLSGDDTLSASGNERVYGGEGRDLLDLSDNAVGFGQLGVDKLNIRDDATGYGGQGQDRLNIYDDAIGYGGPGDDILETMNDISSETPVVGASAFGEDGDDTITVSRGASGFGGAGDDTMLVGRNSIGEGGDGDDTIDGRVQSTIHGNAGDDVLQLLAGDPLTPNIATGGDGDDELIALRTALNSDVELTGGDGADSFVLSLNGELLDPDAPESEGGVRITDFSPAEDVLLLAGAPPSSIDVLASGDNGTELQIGFGNGAVQSIFLENVAPEDIDPEQILFTVVQGTDFVLPGGDFPFTRGDILDPTLGTDGPDTVTTDQDAVIGTGAGNDQVTVGDGNTRTDTGADDDLVRVQGGTHDIYTGTGNDTVEGAMDGASIDLGDGNDVASMTFSDGGFIIPGQGDDTIEARGLSDDQMIIRLGENEGDDNLRVHGNASISDVEAGDRLTLVLSDDVTNIDITVNNDGRAPIDPITIELTDDWTSGDDVALRVVELTETRNWVYVSIGGEEVIRLDFVDDPDALQFNVLRV